MQITYEHKYIQLLLTNFQIGCDVVGCPHVTVVTLDQEGDGIVLTLAEVTRRNKELCNDVASVFRHNTDRCSNVCSGASAVIPCRHVTERKILNSDGVLCCPVKIGVLFCLFCV